MCATTTSTREKIKMNFNQSENKDDGLVAERNHLLQEATLCLFDVEQQNPVAMHVGYSVG
jgi:hypothetical protein